MSNARGLRPKPIGGTIGLFFGGLWSFLGAQALPQPWQMPVAIVGFVVTFVLIAMVWRRSTLAGPGTGMFGRRAYLAAVVLEVVAIVAASNLLTHYGLQSYIIPAVGVIVGLHFIGLWVATGMSRSATPLLWIAGAMVVVSALSALLPHAYGGFNPRDAACGFANALVLWIGASMAV
ncbi:MAG TPA: hypothetical protein VHW02_14825 [Rhizomicrobium sp.]|jgi:hypothetical protein|nr:hypothetical protein [Rhizomicrobium sp.]